MTANQQYKKYRKEGGTLSFAEYMTRERAKGFLNMDGQYMPPVNKPLNDSIQDTLMKMRKSVGYKDAVENKYVLGIHKNIWIGVIAVSAISIGYAIYKKSKK